LVHSFSLHRRPLSTVLLHRSSFAIRHSPFIIGPFFLPAPPSFVHCSSSPLVIRHSPFAIHHSSFIPSILVHPPRRGRGIACRTR
jgi:hypothetical protein